MNRTIRSSDDNFGPVIHGYRDDFDFTLLFEDTILSIAPSILAFSFAVGRVLYLSNKPKLLSEKRFQLSKLVCNKPHRSLCFRLTLENRLL